MIQAASSIAVLLKAADSIAIQIPDLEKLHIHLNIMACAENSQPFSGNSKTYNRLKYKKYRIF
jgi:hypothetical protein